MGATTKGTLVVFGAFVALAIAGIAWLSGTSSSGSYPASFVAGAWLVWLFVLWGALVAAVIFMIAWLSETFERE